MEASKLDLSQIPDSGAKLDLSDLPDTAQNLDLSGIPDTGEIDLSGIDQESAAQAEKLSPLQKLDLVARKSLGVGLEAVNAPFELSGEAVRQAREGGAYRLPEITRHFMDVSNRYLTNKETPGDLPSEILGGLQGLASLPAGLESAKAAVERPKTTTFDEIQKLALIIGLGDAAAFGIDKAIGKLGGLAKSSESDAAKLEKLYNSLTKEQKAKLGVTTQEEIVQSAQAKPKEPLLLEGPSAVSKEAIPLPAPGQHEAEAALTKQQPLALPAPKEPVEGNVTNFGLNPKEGQFTMKEGPQGRPGEAKNADVVYSNDSALRKNESLADYAKRKELEADDLHTKLVDDLVREPEILPPTKGDNLAAKPKQVAPKADTIDPLAAVQVDEKMSPEAQRRYQYILDKAKAGQLKDIPEGQGRLDRNRVNMLAEGHVNGPMSDQLHAATEAENKAKARYIADVKEVRQFAQPGSAESAAMQDLVEGRKTLPDVAREFGPDKTEKMIKGIEVLRRKYDSLLDEVNQTRKANGLDPIQYRQDYMNHFNELTLMDRLGMTGTRTAEELNSFAKSAMSTEEKRRALMKQMPEVFFGHTHRLDLEFKADAIGGFERYANSAYRNIHLQPVANEFAATGKALEGTHPNLARYLKGQASFIAGKPDVADVWLKDHLGSRGYKVLMQLGRNYIGSVVTLNPHTLAAQTFRLPGILAENGVTGTARALWTQATDPAIREFAMSNSTVLQAMHLNKVEQELAHGKISNAVRKILPVYFYDRELAMNTWIYNFKDFLRGVPKADGEAMKAAVRYADGMTARTQALISRANDAPLQRSQFAKILAPLQKEATIFANYIQNDLLRGETDPKKVARVMRFSLGYLGAIGATALSGLATPHGTDTKGNLKVKPELSNFVPYGTMLRSFGGPLTLPIEAVHNLDHGNIPTALGNVVEAGILASGVPGSLQMIRAAKALGKGKNK